MNVTLSEALSDLINQPGLGMFAWMCFLFFVVAGIFFFWALKSGQLTDLEDSKLDIFDEDVSGDFNSKIQNLRRSI